MARVVTDIRAGVSKTMRINRPAVKAFEAILSLESKKGYTDTAVIGGLDVFLARRADDLSGELRANKQMLQRFEVLRKSTYKDLNVSGRKQWVDEVVSVLSGLNQPAAKPVRARRLSSSRKAEQFQRSASKAGGVDVPLTTALGVTPNVAVKLKKLNVTTVRDLLYFFPRRHLDYSRRIPIAELTGGEEQTVFGVVWEARQVILGTRRSTEAVIGDDTGNVRVVWFNQPYIAKNLPVNRRIVVSGKVGVFRGQLVFESPEWELLNDQELLHTGRLVPVYPLTQGLYPRQVRKLVKKTVDDWADRIVDFLPEDIVRRQSFLTLPKAISQAHFPDSQATKNKARDRLAFDELFLLQLGVLSRKRKWQESQQGRALAVDRKLVDRFVGALPFSLTLAQQRALGEVLGDLEKDKAMCRLLQGDVGSGKTVVAVAGLLATIGTGYQTAFMAPTEILAEQHFTSICRLWGNDPGKSEHTVSVCRCPGFLSRPLTVCLLVGSLPEKEKETVRRLIGDGEVDLAIGTHALIQQDVNFKALGLAVMDEQHRFGVMQRSALRQKGFNPHVLVMTATPIPRTLSLTLYGDLDISVIDELPPGRQIVKTRWLDPESRQKAYDFVEREIKAGRQSFVICPLIEESGSKETRAASTEYERLSRDVFPDLRLGLLHGRMGAEEKDKVMRRFRDGLLDILVSTSVVEVGIDVPNASVILVEGANRFGLSQLHQFRGRVGRGKQQSYCLLLADNLSEKGSERLKIIERVHDGFKLAEEDLIIRGPGEFFGTRQSGLPDLRMAKLSDVHLLGCARAEALNLLNADPKLSNPGHKPLVDEIRRVWQDMAEWS